MRTWAKLPILAAATCALAGCGGDGGLAFIPSPPVTPPPTPTPTPTPTPGSDFAIIPAAAVDQQFAVAGGSGQMQVRYVKASNSYEVQVPQSQAWTAIHYLTTPSPQLVDFGGDTATLWIRAERSVGGGYTYSSMFEWSGGNSGGSEAIGMATPASGVPITGGATYSGQIMGYTSEPHPDGTDLSVEGSIALSFDFGSGHLSGNITPNLHQGFDIGTINFRDTAYSTGSTTFSGKFDTGAAGPNSFSGLFTGPKAQELIGNWVFPYQSPIDGLTYHANGAFIGGL